jgi:hypothetical protein
MLILCAQPVYLHLPFIMSTKKPRVSPKPHSTPASGAFPASAASNADSERLARIAKTLLDSFTIEEAIQALAASDGMTQGEAMVRLTGWGRGTVAPFLQVGADGLVRVDLGSEQAKAHHHLLRRVVETRYTTHTEQGRVEVIETEIELYSALDAVDKILQLHGSYPPVKYDHTTNGKNLPGPTTTSPQADAVV